MLRSLLALLVVMPSLARADGPPAWEATPIVKTGGPKNAVAFKCAAKNGLSFAAQHARLSPDGRWLFALTKPMKETEHPVLVRVDLFSGTPEVLVVLPAGAGAGVTRWRIASDGSAIAAHLGDFVYVWRRDASGEKLFRTSATAADVIHLDATKLVMEDLSTFVFDAATMTPTATYPVFSYGAAFTPDGSKLVTTDGKVAIVWNTSTKQRLVTWKLDNNGHGEVTISPDGKRVAATTFSTILYLWDLATQKQILAAGVGEAEHGDPAVFSPDGAYVGLVSHDHVFVRDGKTGAPVWNQSMQSPGQPRTGTYGDHMEKIAIGIGVDGLRVVGEDGDRWYVEQLDLTTGKPTPLAKRNCR